MPRNEVTSRSRAHAGVGSQRAWRPESPVGAASEVLDASEVHAHRRSARAGVEADRMNDAVSR